MPPNANEVHGDKEEIIEEEQEVVNCNQEVAHADEEGALNNEGYLKGVLSRATYV